MIGVLLTLLIHFSAASPSVTVAVIDTGFDLDNEALKPKFVTGETDEESPLPTFKMEGWNFTDNTHLKSSVLKQGDIQEVLYYRALKANSHQQGLTVDERFWMETKKGNPEFIKKLKLFKRHTHGTMVAGILTRDSEGVEIFPVRGLGIEVPAVLIESLSEDVPPIKRFSEAEFRRQVKLSEDRVIRKMSKMLSWIHRKNIRVINASYGVTERQTLTRFAEWHKEITGLELDEIKLTEIVNVYFKNLFKRATKILDRYPNSLFIFSAGNAGQNNDLSHHFPSKLKNDNVMSVTALNQIRLASFSNWGKESVDIAAPGVGIMSVIPSVYTEQTGMTKTPANGTSMAAPFVSNLAARCLQKNETLKAVEVKKIILATGLKHPELKDKIKSEAEAQPNKALKACELSLEMSLEKAIELATSDVIEKEKDVPTIPSEPVETPGP